MVTFDVLSFDGFDCNISIIHFVVTLIDIPILP